MKKGLKLRFWILAIIILGLGIRFYLAIGKDFWFDEAFSFFVARNSLPDLLAATTADNHPPLYYLVLHFWLKLGREAFFLRLPSLLASGISIFLIYKIGQEIFNRKTALIAALIFAFSPLHVYFSAETRMYSLWTLEILASFYFFLQILKYQKKAISYLLLATSLLLALYTHYYTILVLASFGLFLILKGKKYRKILLSYLFLSGTIILAFLPWLKLYLTSPHPACYCLDPWPGIPVAFASFILGGVGDVTLRTMFSGEIPFIWRVSFLVLSVTTFLVFLFGLVKQKGQPFFPLLLLLLSFPLIVVFLISFFYPIFSPRAFLAFSPAFYLIVAYGLTKLKSLPLFLASLTTIFFLSLTTSIIPILPRFEKEPLQIAADYLRNNYRKGDQVAHSSLFTYYPFRFYNQGSFPEFLVLPATLTSQTIKKTGPPQKTLQDFPREKGRLWFVSIPHRAYPKDIQETKNFLTQNFDLVSQEKFKTIEVYLYLSK